MCVCVCERERERVCVCVLKGKFTQNESFISGRVWDAESNGEGLRCMR